MLSGLSQRIKWNLFSYFKIHHSVIKLFPSKLDLDWSNKHPMESDNRFALFFCEVNSIGGVNDMVRWLV
jgi:hypothetical protein